MTSMVFLSVASDRKKEGMCRMSLKRRKCGLRFFPRLCTTGPITNSKFSAMSPSWQSKATTPKSHRRSLKESNLHLPLRRGSFYPLNYGSKLEIGLGLEIRNAIGLLVFATILLMKRILILSGLLVPVIAIALTFEDQTDKYTDTPFNSAVMAGVSVLTEAE